MTEANTDKSRVSLNASTSAVKTWGTACYVLGTAALFALLGWWAGTLSDFSPMWTALIGASLGLAVGTSFRRSLADEV